MNVKATLKRLESKQAQTGKFSGILRLIREGKRYDELTDDQKERYWEYHNLDREAAEEVYQAVGIPLTFELNFKPRRMTPDEERKHLKTIADEIEKDFFN